MTKFRLLLCFLLLFPITVIAQLNTAQSSSSINWKVIDNEYVELIYPDYVEDQAIATSKMIESNAKFIGRSFGITNPKKITIIFRSEGARLNGFVTLGPRRSEFYNLTNSSAVFGTVDFLQTLSIHEYRHVQQLDYVDRGYTNALGYLFGDTGKSINIFLTSDPWFREGDAVWAETKFSEAGRGRTPRFLARLRALLIADHIPTYDNLLAGDFEMNYPNHYVYGYILVTKAYNKFGEKIWKDILEEATDSFYNPYSFYNAFEKITKMKFDDFYKETMKELQAQWKKENPQVVEKVNPKVYDVYSWPSIDNGKTYVIKKGLDTFYGLYQVEKNKEKLLTEFFYSPLFSKSKVVNGKLLYSQFLPDSRFLFENFQDLFIYDIEKDSHRRITTGKRYSHSELHPVTNEIYTLGLNKKNISILYILNQTGKLIDQVEPENGYFVDFVILEDRDIALIHQDERARRSILIFDYKKKEFKEVLPKTHNNLFGLNYEKGFVFFEADYNGRVETFGLNILSKKLIICSKAITANYNPFIKGDSYLYISEEANGKIFNNDKLSCLPFDRDEIVEEYLSKDSPSDSFSNTPKNYMFSNNIYSEKNIKTEDYPFLSNMVNLHSWNFFGGRGFQLSGTSTNYLGDINMVGTFGNSAVEKRAFADFSLSYARYYPIFSLSSRYADRNIEYENKSNDKFSEITSLFTLSLPFTQKYNLFNLDIVFTFGGGKTEISNRDHNKTYELSNDQLARTLGQFNISFLKDFRSREIIPSLGINYDIIAEKALANRDDNSSNFQVHQRLIGYLPGFEVNQGFKLVLEEERQRDSLYSYRIESQTGVNAYTFSRGYEYEYTSYFNKGSINYVFPILYMRDGLARWSYLNRIHGNLFFDTTKVEYLNFEKTLNSTGLELNFDTFLFRKLPLTIGFRTMYLDAKHSTEGELFLGLNL